MSGMSAETGFTLLDLLIDDDPKSDLESRLTESEHERALRDGVEMDIGCLLNTRHWLGTWPPELEFLRFSILNYGLPDLSGVVIDNKSVQTVLVQTVRTVLEVFEQRLSNTKVVLSPGVLERAAQLLITSDVRGVSEPLGFRRPLQRASSATANDAPA
jgi:type VI secretion system lysozyme-like protein